MNYQAYHVQKYESDIKNSQIDQFEDQGDKRDSSLYNFKEQNRRREGKCRNLKYICSSIYFT